MIKQKQIELLENKIKELTGELMESTIVISNLRAINEEHRKLNGELRVDNYKLDKENQMLFEHLFETKIKIDKALEYIEIGILDNRINEVDWDYDECYYSDMPAERIKPLIDILKGEEKDGIMD